MMDAPDHECSPTPMTRLWRLCVTTYVLGWAVGVGLELYHRRQIRVALAADVEPPTGYCSLCRRRTLPDVELPDVSSLIP